MDLSGLSGVVGLVALTWKFIDFLKNLASGKGGLNSVITQLCVWIGGIAAVFLFAESQMGDTVTLGDHTLDHADTATKLIIGLMIGSIASTAYDFKKSFDSSDSAREPKLTKIDETPPQ